jgi:hypothetical protein
VAFCDSSTKWTKKIRKHLNQAFRKQSLKVATDERRGIEANKFDSFFKDRVAQEQKRTKAAVHAAM